MFGPLTTSRIRTFDEVFDRIRDSIVSGQLKPGTRLPSEATLAGEFSVGRQTIREAIRLLEHSGFVETKRGGAGGNWVKDLTTAAVARTLQDAVRMQGVTLKELTETRLVIELAVVRDVTRQADQDSLQLMQENVQAALREIEVGNSPVQLNIDFHGILAQASNNKAFIVVIAALMHVAAEVRSKLPSRLEDARRAVLSHQEILKAVGRRDEDAAVAAMAKHLHEIGDRK